MADDSQGTGDSAPEATGIGVIAAASVGDDSPPSDTSTTGTEDKGGDAEKSSESDFDLESFRSDLTTLGNEAVRQTDLESLKRQAGHIPGIQSTLAELKTQIEKPASDPNVALMAERLDTVISYLANSGLLGDDATTRFAAKTPQQTSEEMVGSVVDGLAERFPEVFSPKTDDAPPPPSAAAASADAQWRESTRVIEDYVKNLGLDPLEDVGNDVLTAARVEANDDPVKTVEIVLGRVDEIAAAKKKASSDARMAERTDAAAGGEPETRSGTLGQYDLKTRSGVIKARKDGIIDSDQFYTYWSAIN